MLWLLVAWSVLFFVILGCGLLAVSALVRFGGRSFRTSPSAWQVLWLGYAFVIAFLQLWSLVLPVRRASLGLLALGAVSGFVWARRAVRRRLRVWASQPRVVVAVAAAAVPMALVVAWRAADHIQWYDTLLYHVQAVKWAVTYPAVPGIANLHGRLGYNNSVHLFAALTDALWKGQSPHLANGFLTAAVGVQYLSAILRPARGRARIAQACSLVTLGYLFAKLWTIEIASLSTDLSLALLLLVALGEILKLRTESRRHLDLPLTVALAVSLVAATTKLGGAATAAVAVALAAWALAMRGWSRRRALAMLALPAAVLLGFFLRHATLSGWILYPIPFGNLHLPWSVPPRDVLGHYVWIESWARIPRVTPAEVLDHGFFHWFVPWFATFRGSHEMVLFAAGVTLFLYRVAGRTTQSPVRGAAEWAAIAAGGLSLVQWFRGAPDLRFGGVFFWMFLAALATPMLAAALREAAGRFLALALGFVLVYWTNGLAAVLGNEPSWWATPPTPQVFDTRKVQVTPVLELLQPTGDEARCGDAPLLCTPEPRGLRLRRKGKIDSGFLL